MYKVELMRDNMSVIQSSFPFRAEVQSPIPIEYCLQLDGQEVHKANEEAVALLRGLHHPDEAMSDIQSKGSCFRGLIGATVVSLVTKNPFSLFFGLSACLPRVGAQQKVGNEFLIPTNTVDDQRGNSVVGLDNGNFVVVWYNYRSSGSYLGVYGKLFNENGEKIGNEFQVNTWTQAPWEPRVTSFSNNHFSVAWQSWGFDGDDHGISCQLFDENATQIGSEFLVNNFTLGGQWGPAVATFSNDDFVVTWHSEGQDSSNSTGVFGQLFSKNGTKLGNEFPVNTYTQNDQRYSSVTTLSDGNFVVAWESEGQDGSGRGVYGQLFDGTGFKIGSEFQINNYTTGNQDDTSVASLNDGKFVVTWESVQDSDNNGVYGQLFHGNASKTGKEFQINTYIIGNQENPSVASFPNGNFVVIWHSWAQDGSENGIVGQLYDGNAIKIGSEFLVNSFIWNDQREASVATLNNYSFVVIWQCENQDGSGWGVYGQIFRDNITQSASAISLPSSARTIASSTTRSYLTSRITSSLTSSAVKTTSLHSSNSGTNSIGSSSKDDKKISWLWALLGSVGGAICLGLTGYFLLRKRSRQKDLSGDPEKAEIPLRDVRSGGSPASASSATDRKGKTTPKAPPIPSAMGEFATHTSPRRDSGLSPKREEKKHTRIGGKYDLVNKISRKEAQDLYAQTGIEIVFPERKKRADVVLGAGNFGKLRIARHAETKEFVGVKKVKGAEKIAKSRDEGALQKKLEGKPHIMPVLDFVESTSSEDEPVLYQFMPLAGFGNGNELLFRLRDSSMHPEQKDRVLAHVAQGLLTGLSHMHAAHIYHFDMKPSNMVLNRKGAVFIIDFGCAKELSGGTVREEVSGDTRYFSPERLEFSRQIENNYQPEPFSAKKADAWALGVTLLELAIGTYPFDSTRYPERLANWDREYFQRKLDEISALKDPPPGSFLAIVKGLLNVDPKKRLSVAEALAQLSSTKPFSNETEQEQVFADLKQQTSYSSGNIEPRTTREQDENYANVYRRNHGFGSTGGYGFPHGESEAEAPYNTSSAGDYQNEFGT